MSKPEFKNRNNAENSNDETEAVRPRTSLLSAEEIAMQELIEDPRVPFRSIADIVDDAVDILYPNLGEKRKLIKDKLGTKLEILGE